MGRSADDSNVILKTVDEIERKPSGIVKRWVAELDLAEQNDKDWCKEVKGIFEIYESEKTKSNSFNILWANTEILSATAYNSTPQPDVRRRFRDKDPLGKDVSLVLERSLSFEIDDYDYDASVQDAVLDILLAGRGLVRIKYDPKFASMAAPARDGTPAAPDSYSQENQQQPALGAIPDNAATGDPGEEAPQEEMGAGEKLVDESCEQEYVAWDKFRHGPGKRWSEVPWVSFEHDFTYEMALEKFGPIAKKLTYSQGETAESLGNKADDMEVKSLFKTCKVFEIWDRDRRRVLFIAPSFKEAPCLVADDPLRLKGFYPNPRPVYAVQNTRSLKVIPPYRLYKEQAKELDRVSARINKITDALRVRGAYAAQLPEVANMIDGGDGEMTPIENAAEIAAMGGLDKAIWLMPVDKLRSVLDSLYLAREQIKATIYEIIGIGDILRGATDPKETASAQNLKSKWGSIRIQKLQREIQRMVRDALRLKAEVIAERFSQRTLAAISQVQLPTAQEKQMLQMQAQAMQQQGQPVPPELQKQLQASTWEDVMSVLRSDVMRSCRVDIETDSTVAETINRDMQGLSEIATALGGILNAIAQGLPMETGKEIALAFCRRARLGNAVEDALEEMPSQQSANEGAMQQFTQQIMQMIEQKGAEGAKQMHQQETERAGLQKYDQAIQGTLQQVGQVAQVAAQHVDQGGQVVQAAGAQTQQTQQILAQIAQFVQQSAQVAEQAQQQTQAAMQQMAQAIQGMGSALEQVANGLNTVLQAINSPKQIKFERGADGRVSGASASPTIQ